MKCQSFTETSEANHLTNDATPACSCAGGGSNAKFGHAHAEVARMSDFGRNETTFFTYTHLGNVLKPGAWGATSVAS